MKIRNKTVLVYDIEVFQNIFHCTVKNTEEDKLYLFEISSRKNQITELVQFFKQFDNIEGSWNKSYTTEYQFQSNIIFAGYNNIHYDNPIINYIIDYYNILVNLPCYRICQSIFNLSKTITLSKEGEEDKWKKWKYQQWFESFDLLTMLYSTKLRVSLKEMQVTMQYPNIQEFLYDWDTPLIESKFDEMIQYNINDVESTTELLNRCKKDIDLRIGIEDEYGVRVLSKDGVNIGMKIITQKYLEKTGLTWNQIKDLRSPMDYIPLKDIILPFVKYEDPILQEMLETLKKQTVSPGRKGYEYTFIFKGLKYTIGVGGIHSVNTPEIIIPKANEILIDCDVASLYASMIIEHKFYPKHLGKEFLEVYSQIKKERIEAKHNGNKVKDQTLKLALNGLSGNLQNEHNFCYSPSAVMKVRINGQLLLLMLAEKLTNINCKIINANTDGLFLICKKNRYEDYQKVCKEWEELTSLVLEEDRFESMYQYAINDYIAVKEGFKGNLEKLHRGEEVKNKKGELYNVNTLREDYIKTKGMFITKVLLGKGLSPKIIPEAIINYFVENIPVEQTIKECKDIRRFLQAEKTGKQWTVEYNDKIQQRTNRFYVSDNGYYLWKYKVENSEKKYQNMLKGYGVTLHNTFYTDDYLQSMYSQGKSFYDIYHINYSYYINQAKKIIEELKPRQLSLFNFD